VHLLRILLVILAAYACCAVRGEGQTAGPATAATQADPAYAQLDRAYDALRAKQYDAAIAAFERAAVAEPERPSIHKDLAYALLKVGENVRARDQFAEALRLDPGDTHVALEYAFLCYETGQPIVARRTFARLQTTDDTAKGAFENIDRPLREGIARWTEALAKHPDDFSGHEELARLAEQREEVELASQHFEQAWKLRPERRGLLLDLGRTWKALGRGEEANAALLAASRGAEPRVAEQARELLPERYPYVYEFEKALELDPTNTALRRELAYLHMAMGQDDAAAGQCQKVVAASPQDLQATAQLGLLLMKRDEAAAQPLLQRVLAGKDPVLVERVREAQKARQAPQQVLQQRPAETVASNGDPSTSGDSFEAKAMGIKSLEKGYTQDALRYLSVAHENDPADAEVALKLGWTNNMLKRDKEASRWFDEARHSSDIEIATEATQAYRNLRPEVAPFRTTVWFSPMFSTRWHDLFAYSQVKTEVRLPGLAWLHFYTSARFVGDTHGSESFGLGWAPQYLSENAVILGGGLATKTWHGANAWVEAGEAFHFRPAPTDTSTATPDYRGGVSFARSITRRPWFGETNGDMVYVHRFDNDTLVYSQNRVGRALPAAFGGIQFLWNWNVTFDLKREYWANFMETGPGVRFHLPGAPKSMLFSVNALRGQYFIMAGNPHPQVFDDLRVGIWYAFTR
jgi:Tfp pilus assembly protein PilF